MVATPPCGQRGWGEDFDVFFDPTKVNVVNQAIGGRSSRTFRTEGRWDAVLAMLKAGDYVIIELGHNDGGPINDTSRARGTIKGTGDEAKEIDNMLTGKHETVRSYGWYLRQYVAETKAKGATPILMSLVPRNSWKDGKVTRARPNGYAAWAQEVAENSQTFFVDHHEISARGLEQIGPEKAKELFTDGLHASPEGAKFNARAALSGLKALRGNPLGQWLSEEGKSVGALKP